MRTHFAPYQRSTRDKVLKDYTELRSGKYISELIGALPLRGNHTGQKPADCFQ